MEKPLRMSSYTIPVKLENEDGKYMLIHGYTGAIDIVSGDLLGMIESPETVDEDSGLCQRLINRGYITTKTEQEENSLVLHISQLLYEKVRNYSTYFVIVVTYNCNFRCPYCFESRGKKDSLNQIAVSKEMVDDIYRTIEKIEVNKVKTNKKITLYGGEPLMKCNKNIVEYIIRTGQSKGFTFNAITNGYDLDSFIDLLGQNMIETLQITVDGVKEHHNNKRIHVTNDNTFDKIISNIRLAIVKDVRIIIRVNIDKTNEEDVTLLKAYLEEMGIFPNEKVRLYASPIVKSSSIRGKEQDSIRFMNSKKYTEFINQDSTFNYCKDSGVGQVIYKAMKNKQPIQFRPIYCGAQTGEYVFDCYGDIYPCLEIVGKKERRIGTIFQSGMKWFDEEVHRWRNHGVAINVQCSRCRFVLFCGGGCVSRKLDKDFSTCSYFKLSYNKYANKAYNKFCTQLCN